MTRPDEPVDANEAAETLCRAEAAARRLRRVTMALNAAYFVGYCFVVWSCRHGCTGGAWLIVVIYPVGMVYYFARLRSRLRSRRKPP